MKTNSTYEVCYRTKGDEVKLQDKDDNVVVIFRTELNKLTEDSGQITVLVKDDNGRTALFRTETLREINRRIEGNDIFFWTEMEEIV